MTPLMTPLMSGETGIVIGLLVPLLVGLLTPFLAVRSLWRDAAGPLGAVVTFVAALPTMLKPPRAHSCRLLATRYAPGTPPP